jgi:hypothetical protein
MSAFICDETWKRKFREITDALQIKFWNFILEITDGEFKCVKTAWMLADTIIGLQTKD